MMDSAAQMEAADALIATRSDDGFLVALGEVDIAIALPEDAADQDADAAPNRWQHLVRLPIGAVVPADAFIDKPDGARLIASAVPGDDVLCPIDPDAEPEIFASGIAAWFAALGATAQENARGNAVATAFVDEDDAVRLAAGGTVCARDKLVWVAWEPSDETASAAGIVTLAGATLYAEPPIMPIPVSPGPGLTSSIAVTATPISEIAILGTPAGRIAVRSASTAMVAAVTALLAERAQARAAQRAERWACMDINFRRSLADFEPLLRDRFKRRLPEVEAQPPLIRAACRVLEANGVKPYTDFVADPDESITDALTRFATDSAARLRPIRLTGDWMRMLQGPVLVLLRREAGEEPTPLPLFKDWHGGLYVEMPEDAGRRVRLTADMCARIEPVGYAFQPTLPAGKLTYRSILQFGFKHARWSLAEIAAWGVLGALLSLSTPLVFGLIVGEVIPAHDVTMLVALVGALAVAVGLLGVMRFAGEIAQLRLDGRLGLLIHAAMVDRLLRLPPAVLRSQPSLILATQLETVEKFRRGLTQQLIYGGLAAIHLLVISGFLLIYNTLAGLLALGLCIVLLLVAYAIGRRQFDVIYEGERIDVVVLAFVYDLIRLLPILRACGGERLAFTQWAQNFLAFQSRLNRSMRIANIGAIFEAAWEPTVYIVAFVAIAWTAPSKQISSMVVVAVAVAFVAALQKLVQAAREMAHAVSAGAKLMPQAKLARSFIEHTLEAPGGRVPVGTLSGAIELRDVSFGYSGSTVLSDISLRIAPGSCVGIVGSSGSGKTTLVRLLLGLENPQSGTILFDGRDLAGLDRRLVRRQIGSVLQHSRLFPGSLFENIRGATAIGLDEAWDVAELAGIADEVRRFPMALHTLVGEDGAGLSGGQVQRLLLARALASQPRILVLDEATSALDQATQDRLTATLRQMTATRIMVAHRFSTLQHCDEIIVLDRGQIVDRGRFEELAGRDGLFRAMLERQTARISAWDVAQDDLEDDQQEDIGR